MASKKKASEKAVAAKTGAAFKPTAAAVKAAKKAEAKAAKAELKKAKVVKVKEPKVSVTDYSVVFPALQAGFGLGDLEKVAKVYAEHRSFFDSVLGFFKGLFKKKVAPVEPGPPAPAVPGPVVVFPPADPNPQAASGGPRLVTGLSAKGYWIGQRDNPFTRDQFLRVMSQEDPLPADGHTKLHLDIDPTDAKGVEIGPGSPELSQLVRADGHPAIVHHVTLDGTDALADDRVLLGSVDDDFGCTPSIKPARSVRDGKDHTLVYWATFAPETLGGLPPAPGGPRFITSNSITLRVK